MNPGAKPDIDAIYRILRKEFTRYRMPVVDLIEAQTRSPFHVLISTILSARTQDATTVAASRRLFRKANSPGDLARLSTKEIERLIFPAGFYRNKAKFLKKLPACLDELFDGKLPDTVDDLVKLPGVGRKTANLVVAVGFKKPAICVDVHVHRICNRLGYVKTRSPFETEMALRKILPVKYWTTINAYLVSFGQNTCRPINPHCSTCPVLRYCQRIGVKTRFEPTGKRLSHR
jgi:endonuclease III